jgi:catechol 2,3-dioxygenase-like lactoylglutathione lyase family enzyme
MSEPKRTVECTIPVLPVRDLPASLAFYTAVLGFSRDWGGDPGDMIASVSRDGCPIMLSQREAGFTPSWVWIGLDNAMLFDEWQMGGVPVVQEPRNFSWAYEMKFADPDGNILWLGTEARTDLPLLDR